MKIQQVIDRIHLHGETMTEDEAMIIIDALKEVQQYREIGTVEECHEMRDRIRYLEEPAAIHIDVQSEEDIKRLKEIRLDSSCVLYAEGAGTNAHKIRTMSDDELADFLDNVFNNIFDGYEFPCKYCRERVNCDACFKEWLQSENK